MRVFHSRIKNLVKRPTFVLFALVVLLWISSMNFSFVSAQEKNIPVNSVSVSAGAFSVESKDLQGWQQGEQAIVNELGDQSSLMEFTRENSAFLSVGNFNDLENPAEGSPAEMESPVIAPQPGSDVKDEAGLAGEAEAEPSPAEPEATGAEDQAPSPEPASEQTDLSEPPASQLVEHNIILKDFSLAAEQQTGVITNTQLRISLAARQLGARDQLKLYYELGEGWQEAGILDLKNELSNGSNNGFFLYALPTFATWEQLNTFQLKIGFLGDESQSAAEVYLDAAWLEVDYQNIESGETMSALDSDAEAVAEEAEISEENNLADSAYELTQISPDKIFKTSDNPDFNFVYKRKQGLIGTLVSDLFSLVSDQYSGLEIKTKIRNDLGEETPLLAETEYLADGEFHVRVNNRPRNFRPGRFTLEMEIIDNGQVITTKQDFSWGVLAINTNKSAYLPAETAYLQMGVLDDHGDTLCNADLFLEVTAPDGGVAYLDTYNGLVEKNPACGPNNVIEVPDYSAYYNLAGAGIYKMKLVANTRNGNFTIYDQFEVREALDFAIERFGPTRIWPLADYRMRFLITASSSAESFKEVIPKNFIITSQNLKINGRQLLDGIDYDFSIAGDGLDGAVLEWGGLNVLEGDVIQIEYLFDAPDISPEYYLLGPAQIGNFQEARQWQIASDGVGTFDYTAGSSAGVWTTAGNAWNSVNNNYAVATVPGNTDDVNHYLKGTGHNATGTGAITKVELGIEGFVSNVTRLFPMLRPVFNGTATGTAQDVAPTFGTTDTDSTSWVDVTADAAGPGAGGWTWTDLANLDVLVHGRTTNNTARTLTIDQIRLRVTLADAPTNVINSVTQKNDGSGLVDFTATVSDVDSTSTKMKVEYEQGGLCIFSAPQDPTLSLTGTSSTYGAFLIDNGENYQIGTTSVANGSIYTASGANTIDFSWDSAVDLPAADGTYCLRVTANDGYNDAAPVTRSAILDNVAPTSPGNLALATTSAGTNVAITFGATSSDTNFREYKIFYKPGTSGVTEADSAITSSMAPELAFVNFNGATSTVISDLLPRTDYVFVIVAYDQYGNKASSGEVVIQTGRALPVRANTVSYYGGQWTTTDGVSGQTTDTDQTLPSFNFALAESGAKIENAYIAFEVNYNAYVNTVGNYTGYKLAFDACQEPCTANAFSGTGNVLKYDTSVLSYRSNTAGATTLRLLLDVTEEAQLSAYGGEGNILQGQVGYNLERGAATTSISSAKAKLVVTYRYYDSLSSSYTNTVAYPLESAIAGDQGTRKGLQADDCTKGTNATGTCPLFNYHVAAPELVTTNSQWFETYNINTGNSTADVSINANIQGTDQDSSPAYIHEAALGGGQGSLPTVYLANVPGFAENVSQQLEYRAANAASTYNYYMLGGEVYDTYFASTTAETKTRTVTFPLGIISTTSPTFKTGQSVSVYFPENGLATGTISIKKAWLRVKSHYYNTTARTVTVSTKVGANAESPAAVYNLLMPTIAPNPDFTIIHVIPTADYARLAEANSQASTTVTAYTTVNNASIGGASAELVITYTYDSESTGRLSSLKLFGGQSYMNGNALLATTSDLKLIAPEPLADKEILAGGLLSSYAMSDSDNALPAAGTNVQLGSGLSVSSVPTCTSEFVAEYDGVNSFMEYYSNVTNLLNTTNNQPFFTCQSINNTGDATAGAKMNSQLSYTYRYNPPLAQLEQVNWRWYQNANALEATTSMAGEAGQVSNVNIADILRLRLNVKVITENIPTSSQIFKLQYGASSDCGSIATSSWADVGTSTSNALWRGYDNSNVADGSSTGQLLLSDSSKYQSYEEENPTAANPFPLDEDESGEWEWTLYNNNASSSQNYCFRMVYGNGVALSEYQSYPQAMTAASNTSPISPFGLSQFKNATATLLANGDWLNENAIRFAASTTDVNVNQSLRLFFEVATSSGLRTATTVPAGVCSYGTAWASCASKVWSATSSVGDYRISPFSTTTSITAMPENYQTGYQWQALACDSFGLCSEWSNFGSAPNFKIDLTNPTAPGALTLATTSPTSIELSFGALTTEANFAQYKIFYKIGTTSVTENNLPWLDDNLGYLNFNGATTTTVTGLIAGTTYAFNIWAYDLAGNKASSTQILVATTTSSFTPPTGNFIGSPGQRLDGSGSISLSITADDADNDNTLRARIQYEAGIACTFAGASTTVLNPATSTITALNNPAPKVDNQSFYQLGTSTGYIITAPGANNVSFDWLSKSNIDNVEGTYCLQLVLNDGLYDAATSTKLVYVDNVRPTAPGSVSSSSVSATSMVLQFGAASSDSHFDHYTIYYGTSSPITEADFSYTDANMSAQNFNNIATTSIGGLLPDTQYYFVMWAYDYYGNRASSTEVSIKTNAYPNNPTTINQYMADGSTTIANNSWTTQNQVKLVASTTDVDASETLSLYFELIASSSSFTVATTAPATVCSSTVSFGACSSHIWLATSTAGDYSLNSFVATATISGIPESASGYKWQVLACDSAGECSEWTKFNMMAPNFRVDTIAPTAPGQFILNNKTSVAVTLGFGASSTEANFERYRLFYSTSSADIKESDYEYSSSNLNFQDFNGANSITVTSLRASTTYYFNLWAYDQAGQAASSSKLMVTTNQVRSTPGVLFYAKASSTLYYKIWNGTGWGAEQIGPTMGTAGTVAIRHIAVQASDDFGKVAILVKSYSTNNQQWWAVVYRMAANDFVNKTQLGTAQANATAATQITGCIGALSSGEFFIIRNNNGTANPSTQAYSWNSSAGWISQGTPAVLSAGSQLYGGCQLVRRPNTDNYLLLTQDNRSGVGTAYYNGTSTYSNSWTSWTQQTSGNEYSVNNYVGEGFFDAGANNRGAFYTGTGSTTASVLAATGFTLPTDTTISYGGPVSSPSGADAWSARAAQGEFSQDPGAIGIAYFAGRDSGAANQLNVYRLDITGASPVWSTTANGINANQSSGLYSVGNFSQKPFALNFYKFNRALLSWTLNTGGAPRYNIINALTNSIGSASSTVPGASTTAIWTRARMYQDPNDIETLAIYQNTAKDYGAIFWDGDNEQFYSTGSSSWTNIATSSGVFSANDSATAFSFTAGNTSPNAPVNLAQFRTNATTSIDNGAWSNENSVVLRLAARDPDTSETVKLYLELVENNTAFSVGTYEPTNACASTTAFNSCASKLWQIATSSSGDYSITPFTATATITGLPDSTSVPGYKWQALACDDSGYCSGWSEFDPVQPNFKIDTANPTAPGNLTIASKTSNSVALRFGATTTEINFSTYKIFYKAAAAGVSEADSQWLDANLGFINYNNATSTNITGLASSTQYVFRIWAYDLAGNKAASLGEINTTTNAGPSLFATSYIFENDDGATVNGNSTSTLASTTLANLNKGERFTVRFQLENRGGDVSANKAFKLQYSTSSAWYDVGANTPVAYSPGLAGSSGSALTGLKAAANANVWTNGAWYANTNLTNNFSLSNGYYSELSFVLQNALASSSSAYNFRLFNNTDAKPLDGYLNYPRITMSAANTVRFSKGVYASLPASYNDLTYYLDRKGYTDTAADDNLLRDVATSTNNYPVFNFIIKHSTNTQAITGIWNGQTSVAASAKPVYLQVYRFGSTNSWITVASTTSAAADTDFGLSGTVNSKLSEHYDAFNFTYWRVYQESGTQALRTDYATTTFGNPVPEVVQKHFRWRENNGTEATASWLEAEDVGSPVASTSVNKGQVVRLRMSAVNLGGGTASDYRFQLQYSTTSMGCALETGAWLAVPTDNSREFRMSTTTTFADQANTNQRLANAEGYTFVAGKMVRDPNNRTASTTLLESRYTENEYAFYANANAVDGATYCFRMSNDGNALSSYNNFAEITLTGNPNLAPTITINPSDGSSGTTTPTNEGEQVQFTATAEDLDGDDYYLAVCQAAGINPGNNGAPTCKNGTWCVSGAASSSLENNCSYTVATSTQIASWFAYACDGRPGTGVAKCSVVSQGNNGTDEDSPFFVNHRPSFSAVTTVTGTTTPPPGWTYTIQTTSADTDTVDENDVMSLFVCKTNSANAAGCTFGAGDTVCQSILASSTNASCQFATPVPSASGNFTYYAFVFDSHGLNAISNSRSSSYAITNVPVTLGSIILNGGNDIQLNLRGGADKAVSFVAPMSDLNGCVDIDSAVGKLYMTGTTSSCRVNNNDCYAVTSPANCTISGCLAGGTVADYTCTVDMKYYAVSTDDVNLSKSTYQWKANFNVYDLFGNLTSGSSTGVELITNMGLAINQDVINFGLLVSSATSTGAVNQQTTVVNAANSPIDTNLYGSNMFGDVGGDSIAVNYLQWNMGSPFNYSFGNPLTDFSNSFDVASHILKTTTSTDSVRDFYWGLGLPNGLYPASYNGSTTFTAIIDNTGW